MRQENLSDQMLAKDDLLRFERRLIRRVVASLLALVTVVFVIAHVTGK